jgi:hypothetical protein
VTGGPLADRPRRLPAVGDVTPIAVLPTQTPGGRATDVGPNARRVISCLVRSGRRQRWQGHRRRGTDLLVPARLLIVFGVGLVGEPPRQLAATDGGDDLRRRAATVPCPQEQGVAATPWLRVEWYDGELHAVLGDQAWLRPQPLAGDVEDEVAAAHQYQASFGHDQPGGEVDLAADKENLPLPLDPIGLERAPGRAPRPRDIPPRAVRAVTVRLIRLVTATPPHRAPLLRRLGARAGASRRAASARDGATEIGARSRVATPHRPPGGGRCPTTARVGDRAAGAGPPAADARGRRG